MFVFVFACLEVLFLFCFSCLVVWFSLTWFGLVLFCWLVGFFRLISNLSFISLSLFFVCVDIERFFASLVVFSLGTLSVIPNVILTNL